MFCYVFLIHPLCNETKVQNSVHALQREVQYVFPSYFAFSKPCRPGYGLTGLGFEGYIYYDEKLLHQHSAIEAVALLPVLVAGPNVVNLSLRCNL